MEFYCMWFENRLQEILEFYFFVYIDRCIQSIPQQQSKQVNIRFTQIRICIRLLLDENETTVIAITFKFSWCVNTGIKWKRLYI